MIGKYRDNQYLPSEVCEASSEEHSAVVNYRDQFKMFLLKDKFSNYGAEKYIDALVSIIDFYIQRIVNPCHRTVFKITDVELLTNYYALLMDDFVFVTQNRSKQKRPTSALLEYIEFVKTLSSSNQPNESAELEFETPVAGPERAGSTVRAANTKLLIQNKRQEIIRQAQVIIRPIEEYLNEYKLSSVITFEYHSAFQDVDVLAPRFRRDINLEAHELGELVSLMKKYGVIIPPGILQRHDMALNQKELRDNVRAFENWLVGYMTYLPTGSLVINSIYYSPGCGFKIGLSGNGKDPVCVKMKTGFEKNCP